MRAKCINWQPSVLGGTFRLNNSGCQPPFPLEVLQNDELAVEITWPASEGAVSYSASIRNEAAGLDSAVSGITTALLQLPALAEGQSYFVRVDAVCASGTAQGIETEIPFGQTGDVRPCVAPSPFRVNIERPAGATDSLQAEFTWLGNDLYTGYTLSVSHRDSLGIVQTINTDIPLIMVAGIIDDELYVYTMAFHCADGNSAITDTTIFRIQSEESVVPIDPPSGNCFPPGEIYAEARDESTAVFEWTAFAEADEYQVSYAPYGTENYSVYTTTGRRARITDITAETITYMVRSKCGNSFSSYSEPGMLVMSENTYNENCDTIVWVGVDGITQTEIQLMWPYEEGRSGYTIYYKEASQGWDDKYTHELNDMAVIEAEHLSNDTIRVTMVELKAGTEYNFKIHGKCGVDQAQSNSVVSAKTKPSSSPGDCESAKACDRSIEEPIALLEVGDTIMVTDFMMIIDSLQTVSTEPQLFKGVARAELPMVGLSEYGFLKTNFDSLFVNEIGCVTRGDLKVSGVGNNIIPADIRNQVSGFFNDLNNAINQANSIIDQAKHFTDIAEEMLMVGAEYFQGGMAYGHLRTGSLGEDVSISGSMPDAPLSITLPSTLTIGGVAYEVGSFPALVKAGNGCVYRVDSVGEYSNVGCYDTTFANMQVLAAEMTAKEVDFSLNDHATWSFDAFQSRYSEKPLMEPHYYGFNELYFSTQASTKAEVQPVSYTDGGSGGDIVFCNRDGFVFNSDANVVQTVGGQVGDAQEVFAVRVTGTEKEVVGALFLPSYPIVQRTVKIIPIQGVNVSDGMIEDLHDKMNEIYGKVGINYTVELDESMLNEMWCGGFDCSNFTYSGSSATGSEYTGDENLILQHYTSLPGFELDETTAYMFAVGPPVTLTSFNEQNDEGEEEIQGKMYRGKQFGFLYGLNTMRDNSPQNEALGRTLAHEVGHGNYKLYHIFMDIYMGEEAKHESNLMSYSASTDAIDLNKVQWDIIHDPGVVWGLFQRDSDSQSRTDSTAGNNLAIDPNARAGDQLTFGRVRVLLNSDPASSRVANSDSCKYVVSDATITVSAFDSDFTDDFELTFDVDSFTYYLNCESGNILRATVHSKVTEVPAMNIGIVSGVLDSIALSIDNLGYVQGALIFTASLNEDKALSNFATLKNGLAGKFRFNYTYANDFSGEFRYDSVYNIGLDFFANDQELTRFRNGLLSDAGILSGTIQQSNPATYTKNGLTYGLSDIGLGFQMNVKTGLVEIDSIGGNISLTGLPIHPDELTGSFFQGTHGVSASFTNTTPIGFNGMEVAVSQLRANFNNELDFSSLSCSDLSLSYATTSDGFGVNGTVNIDSLAFSADSVLWFQGNGFFTHDNIGQISITDGIIDTTTKDFVFTAQLVAGTEFGNGAVGGVGARFNNARIRPDGSLVLSEAELELVYGNLLMRFKSSFYPGRNNTAQAEVVVSIRNPDGELDSIYFETSVNYSYNNEDGLTGFEFEEDDIPVGSIYGIGAELSKAVVEYKELNGRMTIIGDFDFDVEVEEDIVIKDFVYIDERVNGSFGYDFSWSKREGFSGDFDFGGVGRLDIGLDFNRDGEPDIELEDCDISSDGTFAGRLNQRREFSYTVAGIQYTIANVESDMEFNLAQSYINFRNLDGNISVQGAVAGEGDANPLFFNLSKGTDGIEATLSAASAFNFYGFELAGNLEFAFDETFTLNQISGEEVEATYSNTGGAVDITGTITLTEFDFNNGTLESIRGSGDFQYGNQTLNVTSLQYEESSGDLVFCIALNLEGQGQAVDAVINEARINSSGEFSVNEMSVEGLFTVSPVTVEFTGELVDGERASVDANVFIDIEQDRETRRSSFSTTVNYERQNGDLTYLYINYSDENLAVGEFYGIETILQNVEFMYEKSGTTTNLHGVVRLGVRVNEDISFQDYAILKSGVSGYMRYEFQNQNETFTHAFSLDSLADLNIDLDFNKDGSSELMLTNCELNSDGELSGNINQTQAFSFDVANTSYSFSRLAGEFRVNVNTGELSFPTIDGTAQVSGIRGLENPLTININREGSAITATIQETPFLFYGANFTANQLSVTLNDDLTIQEISGNTVSATYNRSGFNGSVDLTEITISEGRLQSLSGGANFTYTGGSVRASSIEYDGVTGEILFNLSAEGSGVSANVTEARLNADGVFTLGEVELNLVYGPLTVEFQSSFYEGEENEATIAATLLMQQSSDVYDTLQLVTEATYTYTANDGLTYLHFDVSRLDVGEIFGINSRIKTMDLTYSKTEAGEAIGGKVVFDVNVTEDISIKDFAYIDQGVRGSFEYVYSWSRRNGYSGTLDFTNLKNLNISLDFDQNGEPEIALNDCSMQSDGTIDGTLNQLQPFVYQRGDLAFTMERISSQMEFNMHTNDFQIHTLDGRVTVTGLPGQMKNGESAPVTLNLSKNRTGLVASVSTDTGLTFYGFSLGADNVTVTFDETFNLLAVEGTNIEATYAETVNGQAINGSITISDLYVEGGALQRISGHGEFNFMGANLTIPSASYDSEYDEIVFGVSAVLEAGGASANIAINEARINNHGVFRADEVNVDMMFNKGPVRLEFSGHFINDSEEFSTAEARVYLDVQNGEETQTKSFEAQVQYKRANNDFTELIIASSSSMDFGDIYGINTNLNAFTIIYNKTADSYTLEGDLTFGVDVTEDISFRDYAIIRNGLTGNIIYEFDKTEDSFTNQFHLNGLGNLNVDIDFNKDGNAEISLEDCQISNAGIFSGAVAVNNSTSFNVGPTQYTINSLNGRFEVNMESGDFSFPAILGDVSISGIPGLGEPIGLTISRTADTPSEIVAEISNANIQFYGIVLGADELSITLNNELTIQEISGVNVTGTYTSDIATGNITFTDFRIVEGEIDYLNGDGSFSYNGSTLEIDGARYDGETGDISFDITVESGGGPVEGRVEINEAKLNRLGEFSVGEIEMDLIANFGPVRVEFDNMPDTWSRQNKRETLNARISLDMNDGKDVDKNLSFSTEITYRKNNAGVWTYFSCAVASPEVNFGKFYGIETSVDSIVITYTNNDEGTADSLNAYVILDVGVERDIQLMRNVYLKQGLDGNITFQFVNSNVGTSGSFDLNSLTGLDIEYRTSDKVIGNIEGSFDETGTISGTFRLQSPLEFDVGEFESTLNSLSLGGTYNIYNQEFGLTSGSGTYTIDKIPNVEGSIAFEVAYQDSIFTLAASTGNEGLTTCGLNITLDELEAQLNTEFELERLSARGAVSHPRLGASLTLHQLLIEDSSLEEIKFSGAVDISGFAFKLDTAYYSPSGITVSRAEVNIDGSFVAVSGFRFTNDGSISVDSIVGDIDAGMVDLNFRAAMNDTTFTGTVRAQIGSKFGLGGSVSLGSRSCGSIAGCNDRYNFGYFGLSVEAPVPLIPPVLYLSRVRGGFGYNYNMPLNCDNVFCGFAEYNTYVGNLGFSLEVKPMLAIDADARLLIQEDTTSIGLNLAINMPADTENPLLRANGYARIIIPDDPEASYNLYAGLNTSVSIPPSTGWIFNLESTVDLTINEEMQRFEVAVDSAELLSLFKLNGRFVMQEKYNGIPDSSYVRLAGNAHIGFKGSVQDTAYVYGETGMLYAIDGEAGFGLGVGVDLKYTERGLSDFYARGYCNGLVKAKGYIAVFGKFDFETSFNASVELEKKELLSGADYLDCQSHVDVVLMYDNNPSYSYTIGEDVHLGYVFNTEEWVYFSDDDDD